MKEKQKLPSGTALIPPSGIPVENNGSKINDGFISLQKYGSAPLSLAEYRQTLADNADNLTPGFMHSDLVSFSYVSSQDLQEPLRKIQTFSSRILEKEKENLSENGKEYLARMQQAAKRMQNIIEDLRDFSNLETAEKKFVSSELVCIINKVIEALSKKIIRKKAKIEINVDTRATVIPTQFYQLLYNLFSNSLKFTRKNITPVITIRSEIRKGNRFNNLDPDQEYCFISFSDNGIGFEPKYNERIFQFFHRLNRKEEYEGSGVGLAMCKKIIGNHNGVITAKGKPGEGALFEMYFPAFQK